MSTPMFATTRDNLVESIPTFRRYKNVPTICEIPEIRQNRQLTDVPIFITFLIYIIVFLCLFIYTSLSADIYRVINGYDYCGNVCGRKNSHVDGISCSGIDMTDRPLLQYLVKPSFDDEYGELIRDKCVERCDKDHDEVFGRCYPRYYYDDTSDIFAELVKTIEHHNTDLIALSFIGLAFAIVELLLFRYFTKFFIQSMLITTVLLFLALTILFWYFYAGPHSDDYHKVYLPLAIIFTILTLIISLIILIMLSRIHLITVFFEETIKVMFTMPLIILEPLLTFIVNVSITAFFIYTLLMCLSFGTLEQVKGTLNYYEYSKNPVSIITFVLNILMLIWLLQLVYAGQHVIISGAISAAYFTRDRTVLKSPVYNSFYNLVKFHLGSVAFGSLLITIMQIIRWILIVLTRGRYRRFCCFDCLESLFKYLTSLGYIEIAMHGQSLCRSSVRGLTLIITNFLSAFVVNSISDYIILMAQILIIAATVGVGLLMNDNSDYYWIIIVLGAIYTFIFSHAFFVAFKVSLDTIFICFCEDQLMNDGVNSSYYTTMNFYTYMIRAQKYETEKQAALKQKKLK